VIEIAQEWRLTLYGLLLLAAAFDVRYFRIPNFIPLAAIVSILTVLIFARVDSSTYVSSAISAAIGLCIGISLFAAGFMGAGDGKLFAASAAWFEPSAIVMLAFLVSLSGVGLGGAVLGGRILHARSAANVDLNDAFKTPVPYGVAIMFGVIAAGELAP